MNDYDQDLYATLGRWPKIGALVGEAKYNRPLFLALKSEDPNKILPELEKRGISRGEVVAFVQDIEPYVPDLAVQSWYAMMAEE